MSNQKTNQKLVLLAGILAAGLFGAVFASSQVLSASAQQNDDPMPVDLGCETGAAVCEPSTTVSTSGMATVKVNPDKFTVTVGVETNGTTAQEAASANADLIAKVIAALKGLGIAENEISTSSYSVFPVYEFRESTEPCIMIYPPPPGCGPKQEITGYKASNSISVTLNATGQVDAGKVIDAAVDAGANTVSGAFYFLSTEKQEQVRDELVADAIASARHRADIAAEAVGMEVSGVKSINLNDVYFPVFSRAEAADTQILPGQLEVSMSVSVTYFVQEES
jgi:uncharacterized protein